MNTNEPRAGAQRPGEKRHRKRAVALVLMIVVFLLGIGLLFTPATAAAQPAPVGPVIVCGDEPKELPGKSLPEGTEIDLREDDTLCIIAAEQRAKGFNLTAQRIWILNRDRISDPNSLDLSLKKIRLAGPLPPPAPALPEQPVVPGGPEVTGEDQAAAIGELHAAKDEFRSGANLLKLGALVLGLAAVVYVVCSAVLIRAVRRLRSITQDLQPDGPRMSSRRRPLRRHGPSPLGLLTAIIVGVFEGLGIIATLTLNIGTDAIVHEAGVSAWTVVIANACSYIGMAVGIGYLCLRGGMPRKRVTIACLLLAGVMLAAPAVLPTDLGGWFVVYSAVSVFLFGCLGGFAAYAIRTNVLDSVPIERRTEAAGQTLTYTLIVGIASAAIFAFGWRFGAVGIGVGYVVTGLVCLFWRGMPEWKAPAWLRPRAALGMAKEIRRELRATAGLFSGWGALYFVPALQGASVLTITILTVTAQFVSAMLVKPTGRLADNNPRRASIAGKASLIFGLVGIALAHPIIGGNWGWVVAGACFVVGEFGANTWQALIESNASQASGGVRHQTLALTGRMVTFTITAVSLSAIAGALAGQNPIVIGAVLAFCAASIGFRMLPTLQNRGHSST